MTDNVQEATKLLRERIPLILDFGSGAASFRIMSGVEDLARDVLALGAPAAPLPDEVARLATDLRNASKSIVWEYLAKNCASAASLLEQQARENERKRVNLVNCAAKMREDNDRIRELEAELAALSSPRSE